MIDVLVRLGNVLFWIVMTVSAVMVLFSVVLFGDIILFGFRLNNGEAFLVSLGSALALYATVITARYILSGNTRWKPWCRDTY